jgi:glycosyltransferase involved in cell wall biosynthesis
MAMARPLSIVMPAHNEAALIEACVREWHDVVAGQIDGAELIVVDDASTDGMAARLEALKHAVPSLRVMTLTTNVGHGGAVRRGLEAADGDYVFQTDSDRQHLPADFWLLWARRHDVDFVFGRRERRADGAFRMFVSAILRVVNHALFGQNIPDANCPFKLMRREALRAVLADVPRDSFIPMVMIAVLARRRRYPIAEVTVGHYPRAAGQTSLAGMRKWVAVGARCVRELVTLRRLERHRSSQHHR